MTFIKWNNPEGKINLVKGEGPTRCLMVLVGEAPGADEERMGRPFIGTAGALLNQKLHLCGIARQECYVTNLVKVRPPENDFSIYWQGKSPKRELLEWRDSLITELAGIDTNIIVPLGNNALWALTGHTQIGKWRGSLLSTNLNGRIVKVLPTYHPAAVLREWTLGTVMQFDFMKAKKEAKFPELNILWRELMIEPTYSDVVRITNSLARDKEISFDIETSPSGIECISFSTDPEWAISIPTTTYYWKGMTQLKSVLDCIGYLLNSKAVKVGQNITFDIQYLLRYFAILPSKPWFDTMIAQHSCYSELPKSLAFLASVYTNEPYYKDDLKVWRSDMSNNKKLWEYNCLMKGNMVQFADGTSEDISIIVKDKIAKPVLSYNEESKQIEAKSITGWYRKETRNQKWIRIVTRSTYANRRGLVTTPEHLIYTKRGIVKANALVKGDSILTPHPMMNADQLQVLAGTVLGDGYLSSKNNKQAGLTVASIIKEYTLWKQSILGGSVSELVHRGGYKPGTTMWHLTLSYTSEQMDLRQIMYKQDGTKRLSFGVLSYLNPLGFAVWYMDDGCLVCNRNARIATCCFSQDEIEDARLFIENKFKGYVSVLADGSLSLGVDASTNFFRSIHKYIPQCMEYKLPNELRGNYSFIPSTEYNDICGEEILLIEEYEHTGSKRGYTNVRYCIDVEANHNFFTSTGLVHNCRDAAVTLEIKHELDQEMDELGTRPTFNFAMELLEPLLFMMMKGVAVDSNAIKLHRETYDKKVTELESTFKEKFGDVNPRSPKQMMELAYKTLALNPVMKKGRPTADKKAIEKLAIKSPDIAIAADIRSKKTIVSNYLEMSLDIDGRLHCSFNSTGTETRRLSSSESVFGSGRNLQNLPKKIRNIIVSDPGKTLIEADLSGAESRVVAYLSEDPIGIKVFESGKNIHTSTACMLFAMTPEEVKANKEKCDSEGRDTEAKYFIAKKLRHSIEKYGSWVTISEQLRISASKAKELIEKFYQNNPNLQIWFRQIESNLKRDRTIITPFGDKRIFFGRFGHQTVKEAVAHVAQDTVGKIINTGIIKVYHTLCKDYPDFEILLQVHDALVSQCNDENVKAICQKLPELLKIEVPYRSGKFIIPVDLKTGKNWRDMEEFKNE